MGVPKALLHIGDETLARRAARLLLQVCEPVVETGGAHSGLPAACDPEPGLGPVGGLRAGIRALGRPEVLLLLGVDLPGVTRELLAFVADWPGDGSVVPERRGVWQPTCARYGPAALAAADAGRSLRGLLAADPDLTVVAEGTWRRVAPIRALDDVDTPAAAAEFGITVAPCPGWAGLEDSPP